MTGDLYDVDGRVIAITGGAGQLGQNFATYLAEAGARVAVLDIETGSAPGTENLAYFDCDVTSRQALKSALAAIGERWGQPGGLINAAALDAPPDSPAEDSGPFEDFPESSWDRIMSVNVKGVFLSCQVIGGAMASSDGGSIINISSIYGQVSPDQSLYEYRRRRGEIFFKPAAYATSKSALYNLTRYLATYWGSQGVRVNCLTLGGVFNNQDPEFLEGYHRKVPLGRMAREDEYNGAVRFLLSDASSYMTGSNMVIDGGFTAL